MSEVIEMMDDEAKSLATRIAYRYLRDHSWLCDFVYDYESIIDKERFKYIYDAFDNFEIHYGEDTVLLVAAFLVNKNAIVNLEGVKNPYFGESIDIIRKKDPSFGIDTKDFIEIDIQKLEPKKSYLSCSFHNIEIPDDLEKLSKLDKTIRFNLHFADYEEADNVKYEKWIKSGGKDYLHGFHWGRNSRIAYPCNRYFVI